MLLEFVCDAPLVAAVLVSVVVRACTRTNEGAGGRGDGTHSEVFVCERGVFWQERVQLRCAAVKVKICVKVKKAKRGAESMAERGTFQNQNFMQNFL